MKRWYIYKQSNHLRISINFKIKQIFLKIKSTSFIQLMQLYNYFMHVAFKRKILKF